MKAVTQKLKSRCGISLAIALVFFLLCAMVGTVVLTAASASAGNIARERQLYRETQALISAAQLLSDDIQNMQKAKGSIDIGYTKTEIVTTTVNDDNTNTAVETEVTYTTLNPELDGSKLFTVQPNTGSDTLGLIERLKANNTGAFEDVTPTSKTLNFGAVTAYNIQAVTGTITVETDYSLTVKLECGENEKNGKNRMTLTFPAKSSTKTEVAEPATTRISDKKTKKTTVTTYTTTITWEQALMQEGGKADG